MQALLKAYNDTSRVNLNGMKLHYCFVYVNRLLVGCCEHSPSPVFSNLTLSPASGMWATDPCTDNKAQGGWLDISPEFCYEKGLIDHTTLVTLTDPASPCTTGFTPLVITCNRFMRNI